MINSFQLFKIIFKNNLLNTFRSPMFEQTKVGMVFSAIGIGISAIYLIAFGTMWGYLVCKEGQFNSIFGLLPFITLLDFVMRMSIQQTPSIQVKPYVLLPVQQKDIITCFLVSSFYSSMTLVWFFMWIPYLFICMCGGLGFGEAFLMALTLYLICVINGIWYLLVRTLANQNPLFWAIPAAIYCLAYLPIFLYSEKGLEYIHDFCATHGFTWYAIVIYIGVFAILFKTNQKVQLHFVKKEALRKEKVKEVRMSDFSFLGTWGLTGEYLKLEIKAAIRCKSIRQMYIQGLILIIMFSLLIAYTDIYEDDFSHNGLCLYCFLFFGIVNLTKIMCQEGNYIDLLMVNKENILTLLRAKYYFYCSVLIIPATLLLPAVFTGKFSLLMMLSYLLFTAGPLYCLLFQLAVYNKQTMPLHEKITGKNKMENSLQLIVTLVAFVCPVLFNMLLRLFFSDETSYIIMTSIGLAFVSSRELWLRNIYSRMMKRHYDNLNGFHATR